MLRELRVLGIGDLCAVRSLDIGAVELLFEGRAHIGQILLAQSVALGGLALGQTDGLGLFCQRVDALWAAAWSSTPSTSRRKSPP